jgi:putative addiction module CopG family antidote
MAAKYHRHVALTQPLTLFLDRQVAEGRYASVSEVVRAALRLLERQETAALAVTDGDDVDG